MTEVLAKVTNRTLNVPRGPDVLHRIRVPQAWLESGDVVELELPRNLTCAACEGGGCDACERSGAVSLRGRDELPELLTVTLPRRKADPGSEARSVVIRIPEQGGLPPESDAALPRGLLLLARRARRARRSGSDPRGVVRAARAIPVGARAAFAAHPPVPS